MKYARLLSLGLLCALSASAHAALAPFSCDTQIMNPGSAPATCRFTVDPNDQSTKGNRPGSIITNVFAGTMKVSCDSFAKAMSGSYPLWLQSSMSAQDIQSLKEFAAYPYITAHFKPLDFDVTQAASGDVYAGGPNGSVLVFSIAQLRDKGGQFLGYDISSTLGLMVGCVSN